MIIALLIILIGVEILVVNYLLQILNELRTMNARYKVN